MKLLHLGASIAAAVVLSASAASAQMAGAQSTVRGDVVAVIAHCSGPTVDTCGGILDVGTGTGSYGGVIRFYVPEGTLFAYGGRQVPITYLDAGDRVRIVYTTDPATGLNTIFNTASSATLIMKTGSGPGPNTENTGL